MKIKLIFGLLLLISAGIVVGIPFFYKKNDNDSSYKVIRGKLEISFAAAGKIASNEESEVASKIQGKIKKLYVDEGDNVDVGDILAELENEDIEAQVKKVESEIERLNSQLEYDKLNLNRIKQLFADKVATQSQLDEAQTKLEISTSALREGKANLKFYKELYNQTFIRSPIKGTVVKKFRNPGENVFEKDSSPIFKVANLEKIIVKAELTEYDIAFVEPNLSVTIHPRVDKTLFYEGKVKKISHQMKEREMFLKNPDEKEDVKTLEVLIELLDKCSLPLGTEVEVYHHRVMKENVLLIPVNFIFYEQNKPYVLTGGSDVKKRFIKTGETNGFFVEVIEGLMDGDIVFKN